jgi:ribose/xylose/arabinose/galactoside ABC-type transport system permease subunit
VASVAACSGVIAAAVMGRDGDPLVGLLVALGVGLAFGTFNGFSVAKLGLTPFVLTLGVHLVARGIAFTVSEGIAIPVPQAIRQFGRAEWWGIPAIAVIAMIMLVLFGILLAKTSWGRYIYLLGTNPNAARYVGIRSQWVKASVYILAGLLSGLAGFLAVANLGAAIPGVGDKILLTIIGGVILGGTSMFGGVGSIARTAAGVLLLATLSNGLNLLGFDFYDQLIAQGVVIIVGTTMVIRFGREVQPA